MSEQYRFYITSFPNNKMNAGRLTNEIFNENDIYIALEYINTEPTYCDLFFKAALSGSELTTLSGVIASHSGEALTIIEPPKMSDGRPIVRADTRPLETQTYFTMAADTISGIGDGTKIVWDMDADNDWYEDPTDPGILKKKIQLSFNDVLYLKDGTMYFYNAPWGAYVDFFITIPAGNYYPNPYGNIPSEALGLPQGDTYSYATTDVKYSCYVNKHHMYGSCPMGDELNAEGASVDGVPIGWYVEGHIHAPATASGTGFRGFASIECYRAKSVVLPGDPLGPPTQ